MSGSDQDLHLAPLPYVLAVGFQNVFQPRFLTVAELGI
jgi:hypothetical protein